MRYLGIHSRTNNFAFDGGGGHNEGMESGATAPDVKVQGTTK